ncbi:hypothetical protein [Flavobacterium sp.]|uniref:hypothetical protein n=1 Tax=Flavobacterium sp. TaxID=239 RepID=UPI00375320D1
MSKLSCICGHIIVDQTDNISYKAHFIRNQDIDAIDNQVEDINNFVNAIKNGERNKWLKKYFESEIYQNLPDSTVISDIISKYNLEYQNDMFLCEKCGRIKIQKGDENKFISFLPEDNHWIDIFKGLSKS